MERDEPPVRACEARPIVPFTTRAVLAATAAAAAEAVNRQAANMA